MFFVLTVKKRGLLEQKIFDYRRLGHASRLYVLIRDYPMMLFPQHFLSFLLPSSHARVHGAVFELQDHGNTVAARNAIQLPAAYRSVLSRAHTASEACHTVLESVADFSRRVQTDRFSVV